MLVIRDKTAHKDTANIFDRPDEAQRLDVVLVSFFRGMECVLEVHMACFESAHLLQVVWIEVVIPQCILNDNIISRPFICVPAVHAETVHLKVSCIQVDFTVGGHVPEGAFVHRLHIGVHGVGATVTDVAVAQAANKNWRLVLQAGVTPKH